MISSKIFGINDGTIRWNYPISLLFALLLPIAITNLTYLALGDTERLSLRGLINETVFIASSLAILFYLKSVNNLFKIILISIICGSIHQLIIRQSQNSHFFLEYGGAIAETLLLLTTWSVLSKKLSHRKLTLVIGYFVSSLVSLLFVSYWFQLSIEDQTFGMMFLLLYKTYIFWIIEFWVGLLIFDRLFKIRSSAANKV